MEAERSRGPFGSMFPVRLDLPDAAALADPVVWDAVQDVPKEKYEEMRAQTLLERKSAINLIEAYAYAVVPYHCHPSCY